MEEHTLLSSIKAYREQLLKSKQNKNLEVKTFERNCDKICIIIESQYHLVIVKNDKL
jgi:hypothetical protein